MDALQVGRFQKALEAKLGELGIETAHVDGSGGMQLGDTLRALLTVNDGGSVALLEVVVTQYADRYDLLHFYTTMLAEMGPGYEALKEVLLDWNLSMPLGAFGIYRQARQLYHSYSYPFPAGADPEALAETAMDLVGMIYDTVTGRYEDAARLAGNIMAL